MINSIFIIAAPFYTLWFLLIAIITCTSQKRADTSPLKNSQKQSAKAHLTDDVFSPYTSAEIKTSISRTRSNKKSSKKPGVKQILSKSKLDQNWKQKVRRFSKREVDVDEPSAVRDPSSEEEKPIVEQTQIFSWNSGKKTSSNESSLDEFEKPTRLSEITATDVSATQDSSSVGFSTV